MMRPQEQMLIRRAQAGNREAFARLYQEHVQAIYRYIVVRVSDEQLAEDLTGDVFTKALRGLPAYQDSGSPFLAWLYSIAHARVVDEYRKRDRRPSEVDVDDQPVAYDANLDGDMAQAQLREVLQAVLVHLTEEQQQVIALRFVEGLSLEETAQAMGKNANAIKALQHRALRALAGRLERSGVNIELLLAGLS